MGEDGARGRKSEGTGAGRMGIFFQYCAIFCKRKSTVQRRGEGGGQEWGSAQYGKQEVQPHLSLLVILLLTLYYENQLLASRL